MCTEAAKEAKFMGKGSMEDDVWRDVNKVSERGEEKGTNHSNYRPSKTSRNTVGMLFTRSNCCLTIVMSNEGMHMRPPVPLPT